jgi:hypothetical protein
MLARLQYNWTGLAEEPIGFKMEELEEAVQISALADQYDANCEAVFAELL